MTDFGKTWDETTPAGADYANTLDTTGQDHKVATRERLALEHYTFASNTSPTEAAGAAGRHKPGIAGVCYSGTTTEIAAITGMGDGALAWDETLSALMRYDLATTTWAALPTSGSNITATYDAGDVTTGGWTVTPTTLANMFDGNEATYTGVGTLNANAIGYCKIDLGSILHAKIRVVFSSSSDNLVTAFSTLFYTDVTLSSSTLGAHSGGVGTGTGFDVYSATMQTQAVVHEGYGRYLYFGGFCATAIMSMKFHTLKIINLG